MRDFGTHSFALLLLATTHANAQNVSGRVLGFDGKPAAGAVVEYTMASGGGALLTDAEGRFAKQCPQQAASLHAQLEGVILTIPFVAGETTDLEVSFANAPHFTLRGQVVLPDGSPAIGKELLCRDATGKALVSVATDHEGRWSARLGEPVREVVVDPLGWAVVEAGPFAREQTIPLDLRTRGGTWFSLRGRVIDAAGPCHDEVVRAHVAERRIVRARTRSDGSYTIWVNTPVLTIDAPRTVPIRRRGPFATATTALDLDEREHGLLLFTGTFRTPAGAPIAQAWIFGVDADKPPAKGIPPEGVTDEAGRFRVLLPRGTPFVFAWREAGDIGGSAAVPADGSPIDVRSKR